MNAPDPSSSPRSRSRLVFLLAATGLAAAGLTLWATKPPLWSRLTSAWTQTTASAASVTTAMPALAARDAPFRTQGISVTLAPGEGAEVLTAMAAQDAFVFAWISHGGSVSVDLHGAEDESESGIFTSYHEAEQVRDGFGHFVAPFTGTHGWYWRNEGEQPVTISVTVSGYFDDLFVENGGHADESAPHGPSQTGCCPTLQARVGAARPHQREKFSFTPANTATPSPGSKMAEPGFATATTLVLATYFSSARFRAST